MSSATESSDPTLGRLQEQISWYDTRSQTNQHWYKRLKIISLIAAALVPAVSLAPYGRGTAAALGVLIVVVEGLQQLNQYQANWITYRSTCEALRHEKYVFLAGAGPYGNAEKPKALLAERVEALVSQEHARWIQVQEQPVAKHS